MSEQHAHGGAGETANKVAGDAKAALSDTLDQGRQKVQDLQSAASDVVDKARSMAQGIGEQARSTLADAGNTAQDLARQARDQAGQIYDQGSRAGRYLAHNVEQNPLVALLVAGAVGYGIAYLLHRR